MEKSNPYISTIRISNYRSLGESVELKLEPITVLVGINGSGKSNLADAFRFISECITHGLENALLKRQGFGAVRRWSTGRPLDLSMRFEVLLDGHESHYEFVLGGATADDFRVKKESLLVHGPSRVEIESVEGKLIKCPDGLAPKITDTSLALPLVAADSRIKPLADALSNLAVYSIFPDQLRKPQIPSSEFPMDEHGQNWTSILKSAFKGGLKGELCLALNRLTGDILDVRVQQVGTYLTAEFKHNHNYDADVRKKREKWFDAGLESDGTLRMAGILTALLQAPPLVLVGIEEPELTVHAGMLPLLYDYLKEASVSSQVLVTTHSPEFLSLCSPESIRIVEKTDGVSSVCPMLPGHIDAVKKKRLTIDQLLKSQALGGHDGDAA